MRAYRKSTSKGLEEPGRVLCKHVLVGTKISAREVDLYVRERRVIEEVNVHQTAEMVSMVTAENDLRGTDICFVSSSALVGLRLMIQV